MAEPVGDLVVDLSLDAARFDEQMARVRRHFSGTESDAKKTAAVVEQSMNRQALAAQKAGISVGQYKAAMRMLPAQFTDVATQLAGGQSPWLILLQHPKRTRKRRKPAQNPQKRLPHRQPVRRRHRHHLRLLQKMRRPDRRQQRRVAPRRHPRRRQRQLAVRRQQHRAKVRRNPRQRAPRQRQNGQRILHPPWRLRMQVRRKRG